MRRIRCRAPDLLKTSKITPLHKKGPKNDVANYRLIPQLSSFSKIFEKLFYTRLVDFTNKLFLLTKHQHGLSKAFDVIWLESYLSNRLQKVEINFEKKNATTHQCTDTEDRNQKIKLLMSSLSKWFNKNKLSYLLNNYCTLKFNGDIHNYVTSQQSDLRVKIVNNFIINVQLV
ncbi:uncharacterized protein LOC124620343 [Schistocerca americana]|uniref:uncharacterized protein LOC124620343 n=1 Tax=Schistocerca americana TaxID=7009 RepID=UPI001F4F2E11|nr:uncharacterized protein LOC124620343 [Schistocerca americana]